MVKIKKKTFVLLVSYLLAAVLFLGGYAVAMNDVGGNYGNTARDGYQHAFDEVATSIDDLSQTLKKATYATGTEMTEVICAKAYGDCLAAQMTMSALPFSTQEMEQTTGFVGRVGDYAYSLCRTAPANGGFSDKERQSLGTLSQTAAQLADQIDTIRADIAAGDVIMDDPENSVRLRSDGYKNSTTLSAALLKGEGAFPEQQELEYDGKYTYKAAKQTGDIITQGDALKTAAKFLNVNEGRFGTKYVSSGDSMSYYFSVSVPDGEGSICVDAGSGLVRSFTDSRIIPQVKVSQEKAAAAAESFIEKNGYGDVTLTKVYTSDGSINCEFAPVVAGAKCYPQIIKISIAGDNGGVHSFDADKYIENIADRRMPAELLSDAQCRAALPDTLSVEKNALAIIQSPGGKDIWCREYKCRNESGELVTIYVSALNGRQQEILFE